MALAGGIVTAVAALAVLIVASYIIYIQCRKAFANVKWTLEIIFIGLVLTASIGVKLAVFCAMDNLCTFLDGFNACIRAIYAGIGGLTFEGLESFADTNVIMQLQCAYFASSAYAGIMTLIIISAKANYEVYSWLCMHMPFFKYRKNIHVITALTEETLYLAQDIKQKDRRAIVAFAGPTLEAFDRRNELCREAMALGVLYWSYSPSKRRETNNRREKSIFRCLFWFQPRSNHNRFDRKYCVYAFEAKDHIPQEENNLELIATDVRARSQRKDKLRIEYFLLTQREINYQAYQQISDELRHEFCAAGRSTSQDQTDVTPAANQSQTDPDAALSQEEKEKQAKQKQQEEEELKKREQLSKEYFAGYVVLNIWCEALTIGRQTIRQLMTVPVDNNHRTVADMLAAGNDGIRVWTIGFAATGQAITGELYTQTAGVDEHNKPRDFFVDVFDPDANELGGIYRATRPRAYFLNDDVIAADEKWQSLQNEYDESVNGISAVSARTKESCRQYLKGTALPLHCRGISTLPIFRFHNVSCNEFMFFERIDKHVGVEYRKNEYSQSVHAVTAALNKETGRDVKEVLRYAQQSTMPEYPQFIVVSTGDDYRNVQLANAIVQDIVNESNPKKIVGNEAPKPADDKSQQSQREQQDAHKETAKTPQQALVVGGDGAAGLPTDHFTMQYIIVNVWDKRNARLLVKGNGTWNKAHDVLIAKDYVLLVVGNNDQIYTTDTMHAGQAAIDYNHTYEAFCRLVNAAETKTDNKPDKDADKPTAGNKTEEKADADRQAASSTKEDDKTLAQYIKAVCGKNWPAMAATTGGDAGQEQVDISAKKTVPSPTDGNGANEPVDDDVAKRRYTELKMLYYALQHRRQKYSESMPEESAATQDKTVDDKAGVPDKENTRKTRRKAVNNGAQSAKNTGAESGTATTDDTKNKKAVQKTRTKAAKRSLAEKIQKEVMQQVQDKIQSLGLEPTQKDAIVAACNELLTLFGMDNPDLLYAKTDLWGRESTVDATMYAPVLRSYYQRVISDNPDKELDGIACLCRMEHERWQRKHWVNGWVYKKDGDKSLRQHQCLCPIENTDDGDIISDLANVLWAISTLLGAQK